MRIGGKPKSMRASVGAPPLKPTLLPPARRDTSGDNVIGGFTAEEWHRKVIADMNRWIANNPGIPLYQGRKAR